MINKVSARFRAMALFNGVAKFLHLLPGPAQTSFSRLGRDKPGNRELDQIGIMDAANQQGVKEIKGDDIHLPCQLPTSFYQ